MQSIGKLDFSSGGRNGSMKERFNECAANGPAAGLGEKDSTTPATYTLGTSTSLARALYSSYSVLRVAVSGSADWRRICWKLPPLRRPLNDRRRCASFSDERTFAKRLHCL